ncbi:MAG: Hint domain-containing protein [Pseudomonadota bacterium]
MADRSLTPGEIALAQTIFGNSIDYNSVRIFDRRYEIDLGLGSRINPAVSAPNGNIYYDPNLHQGDFSATSVSIPDQATFLHEMTHVWQHQKGQNLILETLNNPSRNLDGSVIRSVYEYEADTFVDFNSLGYEEQASLIEDYFLLSNGFSSNMAITSQSQGALTFILQQSLPTESYLNSKVFEAPDDGAGIDRCFLAGTKISMWDGTKKPIEEITPQDEVVSYDKNGNLVPGKVTRVFQNQAKHVLDVFGLHVTPGHVTFCGDGEFEGQHVPIIDILRSDGALVRENGQKVRACTNEPLGTPKDNFVWAITGDKQPDGSVKVRDRGRIRLGTRYITEDGYDVSVADLIFGADTMVSPDGLVIQKVGGQGVPFYWPFTAMLPKPEDYILRRSALMLNEIYQAAEWEAVQPQMPPPVMGDLGPMPPANDATLQAMSQNVPLSIQGSSSKPAMNRKQRKAHGAKQRKIAKRLRGTSILH